MYVNIHKTKITYYTEHIPKIDLVNLTIQSTLCLLTIVYIYV